MPNSNYNADIFMLGLKLQRVEDMVGQIFEDIVAKIERGTNVSVLDGRAPQGVAAIG